MSSSVKNAIPPSANAVNSAITVAGKRSESLQYLFDAVQEKFSKVRDEKPVQDMFKMLGRELENLLTIEKYSPWNGALPMKHSEALMQAVFDLANKHLSGNITLDFAINTADDLSQFLRAYSVLDEDTKARIAADPNLVDSLDSLINSWLSDNEMVNIDGYIYQANKNGEAKTNSKGQKQSVSAQDFRSKFIEGFSKYIEGRTNQATVTITDKTEEAPSPEQGGNMEPRDGGITSSN